MKLVKQIPLDTKTISSALRVAILMLIVTEVAYPLVLIAMGQNILPFQSNGGIVTFNGKSVGSELISQKFKSPELFHPRPSSDSMSGLDPHITPESTFSQVSTVSKSTGIPQNTLVDEKEGQKF